MTASDRRDREWRVQCDAWKNRYYEMEARAEKAEKERDELRDAVQAALDWRGFGGSGTTAAVALEYGRRAILIERKPEYVDLQRKRLRTVAGRPLLAFGGTNGV